MAHLAAKGVLKIAIAALALCCFIAVMAFAPNQLDGHSATRMNEAAAIGALHRLHGLQEQYAIAHPNNGFACDLSKLRPAAESKDKFDPVEGIVTGTWSGYEFQIRDCAPDVDGAVRHYRVVATPARLHITGTRVLWTDASGDVYR
jgi:hypothetical protein